MCNEARRRIALGQLREDWGETRIPLRFPEGLPNMAPLDSVRITDPTVILGAADPLGADETPEAELVTRRWSWPGPSGKPVYNYRAEGRRFANTADSGRCLIPVDGFYEFTAPEAGAKRKTKWLFTAAPGSPLAASDADDSWFCIAGLWRTDARVGEAFTMLTCEPGPDVAPYHARQVVLMPRADWGRWLAGAVPGADLIRPAPAGALTVRRAPAAAPDACRA